MYLKKLQTFPAAKVVAQFAAIASVFSADVFANEGFNFELDLTGSSASISSGMSSEAQQIGLTGYFDLGEPKKTSNAPYAQQAFLARRSHVSVRYSDNSFDIKDTNQADIGIVNLETGVAVVDETDLSALFEAELDLIDTDGRTVSPGQQTFEDLATVLNVAEGIPGITAETIRAAVIEEWRNLSIPVVSQTENTVDDISTNLDNESYELESRIVLAEKYIVEFAYKSTDYSDYSLTYTTSSRFPLRSPLQAGSLDGELSFETDENDLFDLAANGIDQLGLRFQTFDRLNETKVLIPFPDIPDRQREIDLDQEIIGLGFGLYTGENSALVMRYAQASTESEFDAFLMDYDQIGAEFKMVARPQNLNGHIAATLALNRFDYSSDEYKTVASSRINYAPNKRLIIGLGGTVEEGSNFIYSSQTYEMLVSYFVSPNIGVQLNVSAKNFSDSPVFDETPDRKESAALSLFLRI